MARVALHQLTKTYVDKTGAQVPAVRAINLEINDGEFMVLVGPSGCGKSTTLRMVAGLEDISGGTISIDDRVVNQVAPKDRDIAMVFQNYALYPHMSVYDNLAFGLKLRKYSKTEIDARVRDAASLLGLEGLLDRKPKALSGGQRQRVAVGRAIVRKPKVFLFDEPLSNLDAKMRVSMRTEISRLHERLKATVIYVTHDQVEAMTMGDRICVMRDGAILQVAEPLELYNKPATLFVAGFIGSPAMNFFRGQIRREGSQLEFVERDAAGRTGAALSLPPEWTRSVEPLGEGPVILGIRPEDISDRSPMPPARSLLHARVEVVEPMGAETYLYLQTEQSSLVARVGPTNAYTTGHRVSLALDLSKAHLFDGTTEERIAIRS